MNIDHSKQIRLIRTEKQLEQGLQEMASLIMSEALPLPSKDRDARKKQASEDYFFWFKTYFPHYIDADFCFMHRYILREMKRTDKHISVLAGPPEHAKTVHASQFIPLWMGLHSMKNFYINITETGDLAENNLEFVKLELEINERLIADYGDQRVTGKWEGNDFTIRAGMRFWARSMKMPTRGFRQRQHRPDLIVAEDIDGQKRSKNPDNVKEDIEKLLKELFNRLDRTGMMLIMGNNHGKGIALDKLLTDPQYQVQRRIFPAIVKPGTYDQVPDVLEEGRPQWDRFSMEYLLSIRDKIGSANFSGEWQQKPMHPGDKFKEEWFQQFKSEEVKRGLTQRVLRLDPAFGKTKSSDFRCWIVLERGVNNILLVRHCFMSRCTVSQMVDYTYQIKEEYNVPIVGVPKDLWQELLFEDFDAGAERHGYHLPIRKVEEKIAKGLRIEGLSGMIERGKIKFDFREKDQVLLRDQFLFWDPDRKTANSDETHDDGPDCLAGAVAMMPRGSSGETGYQSVSKRGI